VTRSTEYDGRRLRNGCSWPVSSRALAPRRATSITSLEDRWGGRLACLAKRQSWHLAEIWRDWPLPPAVRRLMWPVRGPAFPV